MTQSECWQMIANAIVSTNFKKSITGYKEVAVSIPASLHAGLRNEIIKIRNYDGYQIDSSYGYYYLISNEIIALFRNSAIIKLDNNKMSEAIDDINQNDIGRLLGDILLFRQQQIQQKLNQKIEDEIGLKVSGDYSVYDNNHIGTILSKYEESKEYANWIYDMIIGLPHEGHTLRIIFACNQLECSKFDEIEIENCLLETLWKWDKERVAKEYAKHPKYDIDYNEIKMNRIFEQYKSLRSQQQKMINDGKRLLMKLLSGRIEFDLDKNIPNQFKSLLYKARAKVAFKESIQERKTNYGKPIDRDCNICGGDPQIIHEQRFKVEIKWLYCKKHGYCHVACSEYGCLCCPHC